MDDGFTGCFIVIIAMAFGLAIASLLTFLISLLGVIAWSVTNVLIVWGILILLSLVFN